MFSLKMMLTVITSEKFQDPLGIEAYCNSLTLEKNKTTQISQKALSFLPVMRILECILSV